LFAESDLLPISALQHFVFCDRQAALIHLERVWAENPLTLEGHHLHDTADTGKGESRRDLRISRGLPLRSLRLGIAGVADVVEWHRLGAGIDPAQGCTLPGIPGRWRPFPVEYKLGKPKRNRCDEVQLCAQALCLGEMTGIHIPEGALFYGRTRHRLPVTFDEALRHATEDASAGLRTMLLSGETPRATFQPKCRRCSLIEICRPDAPAKSVRRYLAAMLRSS
jgi:CRISPR-associated exonuclease Cas4